MSPLPPQGHLGHRRRCHHKRPQSAPPPRRSRRRRSPCRRSRPRRGRRRGSGRPPPPSRRRLCTRYCRRCTAGPRRRRSRGTRRCSPRRGWSDPPPLPQPQSPKRYSDGSSQALTHRSQEAPPSPAPRRWPPAEAARAVRVRTRNIVVRAVTRFALAARVAACGEAVELPGALEGWMGRGRRREAHAFALSCTWNLVGRRSVWPLLFLLVSPRES